MNRIDSTLSELKTRHKKMLSPYITAGDPSPDKTVSLMHTLVEAGSDIIELGIPFSDPMAEGPVIQRAMERALQHQVCCDDVFTMVEQFRQQDQKTPIILMGYVNPIEIYGYERFAQRAQAAGVDGTIVVDMPPEESDNVLSIWKKHHLQAIYLCSPTTSEERMTRINACASGYLYYVSLKGVTGSELDIKSLQTLYQQRKLQTSLPLMVGFGIKTPEMAAKVAAFADGVIVGAALIEQIEQAVSAGTNMNEAAFSCINAMRKAIDNQR